MPKEPRSWEHYQGIDERGPDLDWAKIQEGYATLTPQERKLIGLVSNGLVNKDISVKMGLKHSTVRIYIYAILEKLGMSNHPGESIGNERVLLTRVWLERDKLGQFNEGSGI